MQRRSELGGTSQPQSITHYPEKRRSPVSTLMAFESILAQRLSVPSPSEMGTDLRSCIRVEEVVANASCWCPMAIAVCVAACSSSGRTSEIGAPAGTASSSSSGADAQVVAPCSSGGRWPLETHFEFEPQAPAGAPECTPHCGPNRPSGRVPYVLTTEALPYGACSSDVPTCVMRAEWLPECPAGIQGSGPIDLYICRCEAGTWACRVDASQQSATSSDCSPGPSSGDGGT